MKNLKMILLPLLIFFSCNKNMDNNKKNSKIENLQEINNRIVDTINIEKNFEEKSINELHGSFEKISNRENLIPYEIVSNVFLYPVNETIYINSYLKSKYYFGYRVKISDNLWILSYLRHYDLHNEQIIWTIYDSKIKQVKSNLVISSWNTDSDKKIKSFDGKRISINTIYKRHFLNGMEGDNSKPVELTEVYEIDKNYRFIKLK